MAKYIDLEKVVIDYGCVAYLPPDPVAIARSLYAQIRDCPQVIPDERLLPKRPFPESKADYLCPKCGAYINFDGLNQPFAEAPAFCGNCGQAFAWDDLRNERGKKCCRCGKKNDGVLIVNGVRFCVYCGAEM